MCEPKMLIYVILMCELICLFPRVHNIFEKQGEKQQLLERKTGFVLKTSYLGIFPALQMLAQ